MRSEDVRDECEALILGMVENAQAVVAYAIIKGVDPQMAAMGMALAFAKTEQIVDSVRGGSDELVKTDAWKRCVEKWGEVDASQV